MPKKIVIAFLYGKLMEVGDRDKCWWKSLLIVSLV